MNETSKTNNPIHIQNGLWHLKNVSDTKRAITQIKQNQNCESAYVHVRDKSRVIAYCGYPLYAGYLTDIPGKSRSRIVQVHSGAHPKCTYQCRSVSMYDVCIILYVANACIRLITGLKQRRVSAMFVWNILLFSNNLYCNQCKIIFFDESLAGKWWKTLNQIHRNSSTNKIYRIEAHRCIVRLRRRKFDFSNDSGIKHTKIQINTESHNMTYEMAVFSPERDIDSTAIRRFVSLWSRAFQFSIYKS